MSVFYEVTRSAPPSIDVQAQPTEAVDHFLGYLLGMLIDLRLRWHVITPQNRIAFQNILNRETDNTIISWFTYVSFVLQQLLVYKSVLPSDVVESISNFLEFTCSNEFNPPNNTVRPIASEHVLNNGFDPEPHFLEGDTIITQILSHFGHCSDQVIDSDLEQAAQQSVLEIG